MRHRSRTTPTRGWAAMCIGSGICLLSMLSACTARDLSPEEQAARDQAAHIEQVVAAGGTVDSILPTEELLRRFRADLPPVDTLRAASESMEALVARLAHAVGTNDTTDLNAMVLSRQEFAYLYYPDAPLSQPPYDSPPALLWGQIQASSNQGARQLVTRLGNSAIVVDKLHCPVAPDTTGRNIVHSRCEARFTAPGGRILEGNLFGSIIERDGRFKFIGLANRI